VAGVAVLAQTVLLALPAWRLLAIVLDLLSLTIWLWFLTVAAWAFQAIVLNREAQHVTGSILLSTIATQSVAILTVTLFPGRMPLVPLATLVALGYLFYLLGTGLVVERYLPSHRWALADDWDTTNCILHGAMSISGLTGILTGVLSAPWIDASWLWAGGVFVVVEAVEGARAGSRVRRYGWREGLFTYHVPQWARTFTFGMFYAFTLHLPPAACQALPPIATLRTLVVDYGQYVVLALLLVEAALFVRRTIICRARVSRVRSLEIREA
jgi:hypothetical protein